MSRVVSLFFMGRMKKASLSAPGHFYLHCCCCSPHSSNDVPMDTQLNESSLHQIIFFVCGN